MFAALRIVLVMALAAVAHAAPPKDPATEEARARFKVAETLYSLQKYGDALSEYEKAYDLKPLAGFLFNIGQCHRQLGHWQQAADNYRAYLDKQPKAQNRDLVKELLADVDAKASADASAAKPAITTAVPTPAAAAEIAVGNEPHHPDCAIFPDACGAPPTPAYKRWWFWTLVGGAVAAGAVAVIVVAASGTNVPQGTLTTVDAR